MLGLLGDWPEPPPWLVDAIARTASAQDPSALLTRLAESHLNGPFERVCQQSGLWSRLPTPVRDHVDWSNTTVELIAIVLRRCAEEITFVAREVGITPVVLKGLAASLLAYDALRDREVLDLDLLVAPSDAEPLFHLIRRLGYVPGMFDLDAHRIVESDEAPVMSEGEYELPRLWKCVAVDVDEEVRRQLATTRHPRLYVADDRLWVPVSAEVHYALAPSFALPWSPIEIAAGDLSPLFGLDRTSHLVYTCYKAYVDLLVFGTRKAAKLFADAIRLVSRHHEAIDFAAAHEMARANGAAAPLAYVLAHARDTFGVRSAALDACLASSHAGGDDSLDLGDVLPHVLSIRRPVRFEPAHHPPGA